MNQAISLIVGLGNPGPEYAQTRHNAGFRFLERLVGETGVVLRQEARFRADCARVMLAGREVWLLAPQTFMNHSGESVQKFAHFYKIAVPGILIVHDEIDLPPGAVRLKIGGGDGGHNGLKDVTEQLGSGEYIRLRLGVGRPDTSAQVVSYVLRRAPIAEQTLLDDAITEALRHIDDIVQGDLQKVMNVLHLHAR
jgi:PTH1 family peptidyl-tRNA hydrolase